MKVINLIKAVACLGVVSLSFGVSLVGAADNKDLPDLIPNSKYFSATGIVSVINQGKAKGDASLLALKCLGQCPEYSGVNSYLNPAFPNQLVIKVPPLKVGQEYKHKLSFWGKPLKNKSQPGTYKVRFLADAGKDVRESNETNNKKVEVIHGKTITPISASFRSESTEAISVSSIMPNGPTALGGNPGSRPDLRVIP